MKYYLVKCKLGHVGRDKYLPLNVPVMATSVKEASKKAKYFNGIKKGHKDWCLEEPIEISHEKFILEKNLFRYNIYFEKKTRSRLHLFKDKLVFEPNYSRDNGLKSNTKKYNKVRDDEIIKFKLKKDLAIIKSFNEEKYAYLHNLGGIYECI